MSKEGRDEKGRFKEGNLFHRFVKNWNGGAPPKYDNAEDLAKAIAEYINFEDTKKRPDSYSGDGKGVYTLSGCALFLGFESQSSMNDYEKRNPLFSKVIKGFRLFMTDWNEKKLYWGGTFQGSFVWLKNHGNYSDDSTVNNNMTVTEVKIEQVKGTPPLEDKE